MDKHLKVTVLFILFSLISLFLTGSTSAMEGRQGYIVVYKADIDPDIASEILKDNYSVEVVTNYKHALKASFVKATKSQIELIENDENVAFTEENQEWSINIQTIPTGISRVFADTNDNIWINGINDYTIDADVAVIDTGIDLNHPDLNVVMAINCTLSGPFEGTCDGIQDDGNGHGTHVAGIIGAIDNDYGVVGVAPGVRLWSVKVLTNYGSGTTAQVIAGIDYVADNSEYIEVANMSLGGLGESEAMDLALSNTVGLLGVTFVVSAGNKAIDVSNYHPAGNPDAITVSALADFDGLPGGLSAAGCLTDIDDTLLYFSNFGAGVDITAPGACIYSTYKDGTYTTLSGTSMSSPYVAGAAALLASSTNPYYTPSEIKDILTTSGNYDWTDDSPDGITEPLLDISDTDIFNPEVLTWPITLTANGYFVPAYQVTELSWTGANGDYVDIYRDQKLIVTTDNDGDYTDYTDIKVINRKESHSYWLCEKESSDKCSGIVIVYYY
jgi:subtilisin